MIKKRIMVFAIMMLLSTTVCLQPVFADEVYIDVDMQGHAYIYIENPDGTLTLIYNGRDVLAELGDQYTQLSILLGNLYNLQSQLKADYDVLYQDVTNLIGDLELLLDDIYGSIQFLAHVIGINPVNSTIVQELVSGNSTIVDYLDGILARLDGVDILTTEMTEFTVANLDLLRIRIDNIMGRLDYMDADENTYREYLEQRLAQEAEYRITVDDHLRDTQKSLLETQYLLYGTIGFVVILAVGVAYKVRKLENQNS